MCTCNLCCMYVCSYDIRMAESDSKASVRCVCHPFSHSRLICSMLLHPRVVPLCVHTHVYTCSRHPPGRDCTDVCSYHLRVFRAAARNFCINASAFWWVADVSLSFCVGSGAPGSRPVPWGALSWDWTHRPLGVTVALLSVVERGLLRWGNWISKESCFSAQVEGCWFVWDVLHFETHASPLLPL